MPFSLLQKQKIFSIIQAQIDLYEEQKTKQQYRSRLIKQQQAFSQCILKDYNQQSKNRFQLQQYFSLKNNENLYFEDDFKQLVLKFFQLQGIKTIQQFFNYHFIQQKQQKQQEQKEFDIVPLKASYERLWYRSDWSSNDIQDYGTLRLYFLFFKFVKEWNVDKLCLQLTKIIKDELLIKQVCRISFPQLKILDLTECQLSSLQSISWLQSPFLQILHLPTNQKCHQISLKPLSKTNFSRLFLLSISQKYRSSIQLSYIFKMKTCKSMKLITQTQRLYISGQGNQGNRVTKLVLEQIQSSKFQLEFMFTYGKCKQFNSLQQFKSVFQQG